MSSRFHETIRVVALAAMLVLCSPFFASTAFAQSDDGDPEARIQQLENQLRQLTGQNEELQYRNRQLEDRLKLLQGNPGAQVSGSQVSGSQVSGSQVSGSQAPAAQAAPMAQPTYAGIPPAPSSPTYRQPPVPDPGYGQPNAAAPAPIAQDPSIAPQGRRRGDAFDPSQTPNAPGAPRALGGGQLPIDANAPLNAPLGAPGGRGAGEPLDLGNNGAPGRNSNDVLATAPPSASPRDEFDLGLGYMQRRDYALAEQTMRNFAEKYPTSPLLGDSRYWLGESFFQRQLYRDSAEAFLAVTTGFDKSAKAPDALLRLGQSLAALKEKEAACAAFGEVARKYPRASNGVKQTVDREQKRVKC